MLRRLYVQVVLLVVTAGYSSAATGFLDTSDTCLSLSAKTGNQVYLKRVGACDGKPGRVYVDVSAGKILEIFVDGVSIGRQTVKDMEVSDVTGILARADKQTVTLDKNPHSAEMQRAAEQTSAFYESADFQARLQAEKDKITNDAIGDQFTSYYNDENEPLGEGHLGQDERLYIFVSASMPLQVLRTYVADVVKLKDRRISFIVRGFVGGMSKILPTVNFVASVLKKNPFCDPSEGRQCLLYSVDLMVDPLLFRRYEINRVPTFLYAKGVKVGNPDMSEGDPTNLTKSGDAYSISGDASLEYVLNKLSVASGSQSLMQLADKLK